LLDCSPASHGAGCSCRGLSAVVGCRLSWAVVVRVVRPPCTKERRILAALVLHTGWGKHAPHACFTMMHAARPPSDPPPSSLRMAARDSPPTRPITDALPNTHRHFCGGRCRCSEAGANGWPPSRPTDRSPMVDVDVVVDVVCSPSLPTPPTTIPVSHAGWPLAADLAASARGMLTSRSLCIWRRGRCWESRCES
jgi:hypothetical protein